MSLLFYCNSIVTEAEYWMAQELLGNKKPVKTQASERFPLRGLIDCQCGQRMTAGFSKGKRDYYLYYRCIHHTSINLPGNLLHGLFLQILDGLSFTVLQVRLIKIEVKKMLKFTLSENERILVIKNEQLKVLDVKIEELEDSYFKLF